MFNRLCKQSAFVSLFLQQESVRNYARLHKKVFIYSHSGDCAAVFSSQQFRYHHLIVIFFF